MPFILPELPYAKDAFGKLLSAESFEYHHGKHHKAYVDKTNELVAEGKALAGKALSEVILATKKDGNKKLFNNAAQLWNHSFFWQCLSPSGGAPEGELKERIDDEFGSVDEMAKAFTEEAVAHFGSGWAWLVLDKDKLKITSLHDADTPAAHGMAPLFTLDLWEHAYYIDYRNARPDYVGKLLDKAIDWDFVADNLDGEGVSRADQAG